MDFYNEQLKEYFKVIESTNHNEQEINGLKKVYTKIRDNKISNFSLLSCDLLSLQQTLYSDCDYKIASFRTTNTCITGSNIQTCDYQKINLRINALKDEYDNLLLNSKTISNEKELESYIKCGLVLMSNLIEIHPFNDGNGRISRALFNYLLRQVEIPPVNVIVDKKVYLKCLEKAIVEKDYESLFNYYLNKINAVNNLKKGEGKCKKTN